MADIVERVFYHPPKSRAFGHGSRFRDRAKTWETTKAFLVEFADTTVPEKIELHCGIPNQWRSAEVAQKRLEEAKAAFGSPTREIPTNGADWTLCANQLENAVAFELAVPKIPKDTLPASSLWVHYRFRWRVPWDKKDADSLAASHLSLHLSGGSIFLQPGFTFLASIDSAEFREQLMMIEKVVPFKFNDAYFKRWVINLKRNNIGRYLKPKKDWRGNWNTN